MQDGRVSEIGEVVYLICGVVTWFIGIRDRVKRVIP